MSIASKAASCVVWSLIAVWSIQAVADPPDHAPAHGWRKKHDPYYVGYTGIPWEHDYEITTGHCNREAIATVIGGVVGGVVGSKISSPENRTVATIVGVIVGAAIGNKIGKDLDEADRGCFGHALEIGMTGQHVTWTNDALGVRYELTPGADRPRNGYTPCREYTLVAARGKDKSSESGVACQTQPGVWQVAR
jgi:surface antigen